MEITTAGLTEIGPIADLLADVFIDDPVESSWVAGKRDPRAALAGFQAANLKYHYVPLGRVDVLSDEQGPVACALWAAPGNWRTPRRAALAAAKALGRSYREILRTERPATAFHPRFDHWYLNTLAVSPRAQGAGLGSTLLEHGLAHSGGLPVYLESTTAGSARLYRRFDFVSLGEIPGSGGQVGMWRPGV